MSEHNELPQIQAVRLRVSGLFTDGIPAPAAHGMYVTDAFVKVGFAPVYKDGTEIEDENAQGGVCAYVKGEDTFKRGDVTIEICSSDPYLTAIMEGGSILDIEGSARTGYAAPPLGPVPTTSFSLEVWAKRIDNGDLDVDSPYAWWAYPKIKNVRPNEHEHGNSTLKRTFVGQAYENANWSDGPTNDWPAASDRVWQWVPTDTLPAVTYSTALVAS